MDLAFHLGRLVLVAVFAVAGLAKLADRPGTDRAVVGFGVPQALAPLVARTLPVAELAAAAALLVPRWAVGGAVAATVLLGLFVVAIAANLLRGRQPDCNCFGQLHSRPVGLSTLGRNAVLLGLSVFVAWTGGDRAGDALSPLAGIDVGGGIAVALWLALVVVVGVQGWLLANLLRQQGAILLRLEALEARSALRPGVPVGSPAPAFTLQTAAGDIVGLEHLRASGKPTLLVFSDPDCQPCRALYPEVVRWDRDHAERVTVAVVTRRVEGDGFGPPGQEGPVVLFQEASEVADAFHVSVMPSAVVVLPTGAVGSELAAGADGIRTLVDEVVHGGHHHNGHAAGHHAHEGTGHAGPPALGRGDPVPPVQLPDLTGRPVNLHDPGARSIVLFWSPSCPFCTELLPQLEAWEAQPPSGAPRLVLVSTGTVESNREMGLRSPVLLDEEFRVGRAFGAGGTPAAVLVDADGMVASDLAVGLPDVSALLASQGQEHAGPTRRRRR